MKGCGSRLISAKVCNNLASLGGFVILTTPGIVLFAKTPLPDVLVVGVYK